jgi:hypothetical protein
MEHDHKLVCEHQQRLNNAVWEVVKNEVLKLLKAGVVYPISHSEWVSPVQVVPGQSSTSGAEEGWNDCYLQ